MQAPRHANLRHVQRFCDRIGEFLKRAEWAQPAAEGTSRPEDQCCGDCGPQDEDERRRQKIFPMETGGQRVRKDDHVDDGELCIRVPAKPHQSERQKHPAHPREKNWPANQHVLEKEDYRQNRQGGHGNADRNRAAHPHLFPESFFVGGRGLRRGHCRGSHGNRRQRLALDVAIRQLVSDVEGQECLVARACCALGQQLKLPLAHRIECKILRNDEEADLREIGGALRFDRAEASMVTIAKSGRRAFLNELDAIEYAASDVAGAFE